MLNDQYPILDPCFYEHIDTILAIKTRTDTKLHLLDDYTLDNVGHKRKRKVTVVVSLPKV